MERDATGWNGMIKDAVKKMDGWMMGWIEGDDKKIQGKKSAG